MCSEMFRVILPHHPEYWVKLLREEICRTDFPWYREWILFDSGKSTSWLTKILKSLKCESCGEREVMSQKYCVTKRRDKNTDRVWRKGVTMLATVATSRSMTWRTVNRTLISLSTNARAFEFSNESKFIPSCCKCWCCWCSMREICVFCVFVGRLTAGERKTNDFVRWCCQTASFNRMRHEKSLFLHLIQCHKKVKDRKNYITDKRNSFSSDHLLSILSSQRLCERFLSGRTNRSIDLSIEEWKTFPSNTSIFKYWPEFDKIPTFHKRLEVSPHSGIESSPPYHWFLVSNSRSHFDAIRSNRSSAPLSSVRIWKSETQKRIISWVQHLPFWLKSFRAWI